MALCTRTILSWVIGDPFRQDAQFRSGLTMARLLQ